MKEVLNINFESIIQEFQEDYPNLKEFRIREILEERLLEMFKEYIVDMEIPNNIDTRSLRIMRSRIKIIQKSHRWDKKIDSIINRFKVSLQYLKLKNIQDDLKTWENFTKNNYFSAEINGFNLKYLDETYLEFNGNKNVDTKIEDITMRKNQSHLEYENVLFNDGGYDVLESELETNFESFEDSVKEFEKFDKVKENVEEQKISINNNLLDRIMSLKASPIEKKKSQNLSMEALKKDLDDLDKKN